MAATMLLAASFMVAESLRSLEPRHQLSSMSRLGGGGDESAGFADWYAIVALFRRPLGLPMPHSAVIARNRGRIAEKFRSIRAR